MSMAEQPAKNSAWLIGAERSPKSRRSRLAVGGISIPTAGLSFPFSEWAAPSEKSTHGPAKLSPRAALLRDIFRVPSPRPVTFEVAWKPSVVVGLAQAIYDERAFDRMPILADALQDAGCEDADILGHCRSSGLHVRGCWVVDLVL